MPTRVEGKGRAHSEKIDCHSDAQCLSCALFVHTHVPRARARASQPRLRRAEIDADLAHRTVLHQIIEGRPPLMEPIHTAARWAQLAPGDQAEHRLNVGAVSVTLARLPCAPEDTKHLVS